MSPSGDERAKQPRAKGPTGVFAFERSEQPSSSLDDSLPLRLSVAQGGLGIELSRPVRVGPAVVTQLDLALLGVSYPVDLTKGVKQFRSRRSSLRSASFRVDLEEVSKEWADALEGIWGEPARVRLRPVIGGDAAGNDSSSERALGVTVYSSGGVLAFDLVLTSGTEPRIVLDRPRAAGTLPCFSSSSLRLALRVAEAGIAALAQGLGALPSVGRGMELSGIAGALSMAILPPLGCRLPQVDRQVVREVRLEKGALEFFVGALEEPFVAGRRALLCAGAAQLTEKADELVAQGSTSEARAAYLDALEQAPGHVTALVSLADLDLHEQGRAESALSFFLEADSSRAQDREVRASIALGMSRALSLTGRKEAGREALEKAISLESDPTLAAYLSCDLAEKAEDDAALKSRVGSILDAAIARAPHLRRARLLRFEWALRGGEMNTAVADAEQLEASCAAAAERGRLALTIGERFAAAGHPERASQWLSRALRFLPDDAQILRALARCYRHLGDSLRAAELAQNAVRQTETLITELTASSRVDASAEELDASLDLRAELNLLLAELLSELESDEPQILAHLGAVDTKSPAGVASRLMEAELFQRRGDVRLRDQSLHRLLEAWELHWVQLGGAQRERLGDILNHCQDDGDGALKDFASRLLAERD